jgi:hypothetical protein
LFAPSAQINKIENVIYGNIRFSYPAFNPIL